MKRKLSSNVKKFNRLKAPRNPISYANELIASVGLNEAHRIAIETYNDLKKSTDSGAFFDWMSHEELVNNCEFWRNASGYLSNKLEN